VASEGYHEPIEKLDAAVIERHRAIISLMEELEAIDWYDQRVSATEDAALRAILVHNRDEEKEHAAMTLEWLRRHDDAFDRHLHTYLFTEAPVTEIEEAVEGGGDPADAAPESHGARDASLGIGSLDPPTRKEST